MRTGAGLAAVGLATFTANHYSNQFLQQSVASQYAYGSNFMPAARSMFENYYTAFSAQDAAQAAQIQSSQGGYLPGSPQYAAQRTANQSISYADPTISAAQAAGAATAFQNPSTFNRLQVLGINPINNQGVVNIHQLAQQILALVPWYRQIKTPQQIQAELYDPAGGIYVTLQNMMSNGFLPAASYKAVQAAIGDILRAQIKGVSPAQLAKLEAAATDQNNGTARTILNQLGIGNSLAQTQKAKVGANINTEVETLGGFTTAVKGATNALTAFRDHVNDILNFTHLGGIVGGGEGLLGAAGGVIKTAGGYVIGKGIVGALRGGGSATGGIMGRAGGLFRGFGSGIGEGAGTLGRGVASVGRGTGNFFRSILHPNGAIPPGLQNLEERSDDVGPGGMGGFGGMAPKMSSIAYSAHRGGRSFATGGGDQGQSKQSGQGGGASNAGGGISFIPPGPGVNSLEGETDFGPRNIGQGFHTGIDLMRGMQGATIRASADGQVQGAGWGASGDSGYGNTVMINHGGGYVTMYAHMATISVSRGAQVRQGQGIGTVGDTGAYSRGPHLHFELHINGKPVDPVPYLTGKHGSYSGPAPGGKTGASGAAGTGADMGSASAFANGNKYGSTEEVDALASLLSGAASVGSSGTGSQEASVGAGNSSKTGSGASQGSSGSFHYNPSQGVEQWRGDVVQMMGKLGVRNPAKSLVDRVLMQMQTESGGNPTIVNKWDSNWQAGHPSVGLMQVIAGTFREYAGPYLHTGPFSYGVSTNPDANIYAALNYARDRYGSWTNAFHGHGYAKGAWNLPSDELAHVHKGEMIIPSKVAEAVRNELTAPGIAGKGGGVALSFGPGSVVVHLSGAATADQGYDAGKAFVDAVYEDRRIKELARGGAFGG